MTTIIPLKPQQQEHCDLCKRSLRIRILSVKPSIVYEIYGNPTSEYGGLFCSASCSLIYCKNIRRQKKRKDISNLFKEINR